MEGKLKVTVAEFWTTSCRCRCRRKVGKQRDGSKLGRSTVAKVILPSVVLHPALGLSPTSIGEMVLEDALIALRAY
jgi:hypothetical protein